MATNRFDLVDRACGTIPQFLAGKNIFVTGFTGFLGKCIVQKILTNIPDVGAIYVLIRENKNKTVAEKLQHTLNDPIFNHLRGKTVLEKIIPIAGDLTKLNLGISDTSRQEIIDNVNIVYHIAATIRFDMPLQDAVITNVRATRDVCALALDLKKCDVFMHVSTSFCQIKYGEVEEKLYPSPFDWKEIIEVSEKMSKFELDIVCQKLIEEYPNTYTFTKAIAESVVSDMCTTKIPTIIFRPSIVTVAQKDPIPGWTDNFNGPVGVSFALAKGISRCLYFNPCIKQAIIPVDVVINYMLKATWYQQFQKSTEISVYNCTSLDCNAYDREAYRRHGLEVIDLSPMDPLWHINISFTSSMFVYFINSFFFHFLPSLFGDFLLHVTGKPKFMAKLQRKIYIATTTLQYFLSKDWQFVNNKCLELDDYLQESDKEIFFESSELDFTEYILRAQIYLRVHLLKETITEENTAWFRRKAKIFAVLHFIIKYTTLFLIIYWSWNNIFVPILDNVYSYLENL